MDGMTVFIKSAKGRDEIETHAHTISENARRILVMINGELTLDQLLKKAAIFRNVEGEIEQLFRAGYIVRLDGESAPSASFSAQSTADFGGKPSQETRVIVEEEFVEFAGPIAALLCDEIFAKAVSLEDALGLLSRELDTQQAQKFRQNVAKRLAG